MTTRTLTEPSIGETLQRLRTAHGLSLRTLATRTGFSPSFVSQVENGQTSPSIASLDRLADALGFGLADFFGQVEAGSVVVVRQADREGLTSDWSRARLEPLVGHGALRSLEGMLVTLRPGGRSGKVPAARPFEQLAIVLSGQPTLTLPTAEHRLTSGDAAAIPAGSPHLWENRDGADACFAVVSLPQPR